MKENIAVIFGGISVEHDISVITGLQVLANLDRQRDNIIPIYIAKDGRFLTDERFWNIESFAGEDNFGKAKQVILGNGGNLFWVKGKKAKLLCKIDFAYLALHGGRGENGCVQGLLDCCGVRYSSSDCYASNICMNKNVKISMLKLL